MTNPAPHGYRGDKTHALCIIGEGGKEIYAVHHCPHCGSINDAEEICYGCGKAREKIVTDRRPLREEATDDPS